MLENYVRQILTAKVYDVASKTPLDRLSRLSKRLGAEILLKREDLQPVFSFKCRGAYNKLAQLEKSKDFKGVVAASAGNHAQGVALAAQRLGFQAYIVMPTTTPAIKISAVEARGAKVILEGDNFDQAYVFALNYQEQHGLTFVHPFDDPLVIAGQGTVGLEIIQQATEKLDAIFVPVGGGGLLAGIAVIVKFLRPEVQVIGVEPEDADSMAQALHAGAVVTLPRVGLFAEGVAVKRVGNHTFALAKHYVDTIITVNNDEMCAAIKDIFEDTRTAAEPAGALALAGLKRYWQSYQQDIVKPWRAVAIHSGANVNFDRLGYVVERAEIGEKRETLWAVTIPERPGSFKIFCETIGIHPISEFNYRYADAECAQVFVGIKFTEANLKIRTLARLQQQGYAVQDLSENELAKLHLRHLVGGRRFLPLERLYRFEFPERPGALLEFLTAMRPDWNISLFHYRSHGADYGRVLVGFEVLEEQSLIFENFLRDLGYPFVDERENPAYSLFLR